MGSGLYIYSPLPVQYLFGKLFTFSSNKFSQKRTKRIEPVEHGQRAPMMITRPHIIPVRGS